MAEYVYGDLVRVVQGGRHTSGADAVVMGSDATSTGGVRYRCLFVVDAATRCVGVGNVYGDEVDAQIGAVPEYVVEALRDQPVLAAGSGVFCRQ